MSAPVLMNRETREKGFKNKHQVGEDDRAFTKAIPGYTGHIKNAKDIFGLPSGKLLETDAHGGISSHVSQPVKASSGSTFISALPSDGAVWDHHYETTTNSMYRQNKKAAQLPNGNIVGFTGHVHSSHDIIGRSHNKVVELSGKQLQALKDENELKRQQQVEEEVKPHWTKFATQHDKPKSWKQEYTQTLTTRPNPRKQQPGDPKQSPGLSQPVRIAADIVAAYDQEKASKGEEYLDMGPRPLFLYDNTLMTEAPEDERGYTGHFSAAKTPKRVVGYTGHLHGAQDTLGLNFGRVERRVNPYEKPPEEKHPLGARYQNAAPPIRNVTAQVKALVQAPSRPKKSGVDIVDAVRTKIMQRGGRNGFRSLVRILRIMDDDGNRNLNKYELQSGLNTFGIHPTPQEMEKLMTYFDRDGSGQISITEFVRGIRGDIPEQRRGIVMQAFRLLDATLDGQVTIEDFQRLYDASRHPEVLAGEKTACDVLVDFMKHWDRGVPDQIITEAEFLDYYSDLSAGIDNDQYFELMVRNAWHISGGEGVAECTTCRRVCVVHTDGSETVETLQNDLGITSRDVDRIIQRLNEQGITDIKEIKL